MKHSKPSGLALHQGVLYVLDYTTGIIYGFSGPVEWLIRRATHRPFERMPEPAPGESSQG